ncbi:MAG: class I SAM-dependent methyltransferase [Bacteroidia bacterium]|nr:class I SAM-dependent methyltransferase [Bacteroidia bacterium]
MSTTLFFIRKTKALFIRFQLHRLVEPFSGFLLNLAYLSKISKWAHENRKISFNDFYSNKWDYEKRFGLYKHLNNLQGADKQITYLEFGVSQGHSFKWWVANNKNEHSVFCGFDTFEGLPEDWGMFKAGAMSTHNAIPQIDGNRHKFIKGLFQQTLPDFIKAHDLSGPLVLHLDADLYSSTLYVLTSLAPHLKSGDILIFDEFSVPKHEFLAYTNFIQSYYLQFELIAAANNYFFTAFRMK